MGFEEPVLLPNEIIAETREGKQVVDITEISSKKTVIRKVDSGDISKIIERKVESISGKIPEETVIIEEYMTEPTTGERRKSITQFRKCNIKGKTVAIVEKPVDENGEIIESFPVEEIKSTRRSREKKIIKKRKIIKKKKIVTTGDDGIPKVV